MKKRVARITSLDDVKDEAAETIYGIGSKDGELPPLELWLREQSRLHDELEAQNEPTIWSMTADPLDLLIAREEAKAREEAGYDCTY